MAINIKFTKFDNTPWGFRLAGGSDFPQPLTVIKVMEGSLAECMGLKVGDVVVRLNDQPISNLTHGQAHEALVHAGNNFVLGTQREEEARKAAAAISEENIVPYKIALADLPPVFPEQILKEETVIERYEEEKTVVEPLSAEDEVRREEDKLVEEKPVDANSEIVPNKNLTDDEIAQLILEEEELLSDKGLLGVNFKKLRPRAPILKDSKVLEELQHIATAEPERVQELKRASTFLQKPQRPVPKPKIEQKAEEDEGESYKVVIKKQDKKTVITRLVEKGLLPPGSEATVARTPEPPEPLEVKMHETRNRLEEDRPPLVSDPNSLCSTFPPDNTDDPSSPPRAPKFDSDETCPFEDQPTHCATCKSKLFHAKPSQYRRHSFADKYNEAKTRSPFKGHYVENVLRGYVRSYVPHDREIDDRHDEFAKTTSGSVHFQKYDCLRDISLSGNILKKRTSRCARAHYAERILLRNASAVARYLDLKPKMTRVRTFRTKGRYLATCLHRESIRLISFMTMLFQFFLQIPDIFETSNVIEVRRRRSSFKGRYLEHVLQKNVSPVLQHVKETCFVDDQLKMIEERKNGPRSTRTKGRYIEKCLHRQNLRLRFTLAKLLEYAKSSFDKLFALSSKAKYVTRARYCERLFRRNLEILELFAEYVRSRVSEWLEEGPSCTSRKEFPVIAVSASNYITDDSVLNERKIDDEDVRDAKISEWHEDGPSCALQKESPVIVSTSDNPDLSEEKFDESDRSVLECTGDSISPEADERSNLSTEAVSEQEDTFSKFLQSAEDYVSAEVFHRGSRRLSRSRKSIVPDEDDNAISKFLQSAENYVSAEVFHRRSRRLSRSSKDAGRENGALSSLLRSTGDYVSSEVFHRRNRRLSRSSRRESISLVTPTLWSGLKGVHFSLPWFSLRITEKSTERSDDCEEKIDSEIERDNRRLSFVPTILYQGITNRIDVDFTRLVAYAFVPCTSIILLYMYK